MIIGRAQGKGDAIQGVNKMQCDKFSGKWKSDTCHCGDGRTLYTLNNKISCFAGIGENIGCKLKIEGSNEVVAFYKKSKDNMNIGDISEQSYLGKCQPNPEVLVWQPNGWRLAKIRVKVLKKQISVGWVNANYTTQVQGQLFKMTFFKCEKNPGQACLLFKNIDGKSRFSTTRVTTQATSTIANTTSTTLLTQTKSQGKNSSNQIVIALGICCAILVIAGIISFLLWFRRRKYMGSEDKSCWKWNQIKRSVFKEEEPSENIYEDIGKTKLQEVQKREKCDDLYLVPLELSNTMRSTMKNSPYTYAQHVEDDETLSGQCYTQPKYDGGELYEEPACEGEYYEEPAHAEEYYEDPANNDLYEEPGMTSEERYSALAEDDTSIKKDYYTLRKDDIYEEADSTHMPAQPIYFETEPEI